MLDNLFLASLPIHRSSVPKAQARSLELACPSLLHRSVSSNHSTRARIVAKLVKMSSSSDAENGRNTSRTHNSAYIQASLFLSRWTPCVPCFYLGFPVGLFCRPRLERSRSDWLRLILLQPSTCGISQHAPQQVKALHPQQSHPRPSSIVSAYYCGPKLYSPPILQIGEQQSGLKSGFQPPNISKGGMTMVCVVDALSLSASRTVYAAHPLTEATRHSYP